QASSKQEAGRPPEAQKFAQDQSPEFPATSHLSIVDKEGNAVAMTTTIEDGLGSRIMVGGFLLNNELTDFSFVPEDQGRPVANRVEGGKRPRSSMAPTMVYDPQGKLWLITGSPGGSAIINYVAKVLIAAIDLQLDPQTAINLPNVGSRGAATELELGSAAVELKGKLEAMNHKVNVLDFTSGVHSIQRQGPHWVGAADPRREGKVVAQ
ncbi:MAG: hypothetical protein RLZZ502_485, partial [Pseudomonadota bacterium]